MSLQERVEQFDKEHSRDGAPIVDRGWLIFPDGARREADHPEGILAPPPDCPYQRALAIRLYFLVRLRHLVWQFDELKNGLQFRAREAAKPGAGITPPPQHELDALKRIISFGVHKEPRVRRETVRSLGQIGGPDAAKRLLFYVKDKDEIVVRESIRQLMRLRVKECAPVLNKMMTAPDFPQREAATVIVVAEALAALGNEESLKLLEELTGQKRGKGRLYSAEVLKAFEQAAEALTLRPSED